MRVKTTYEPYLMHYGRSKEDGAPGVGTGNWRRSGSGGGIKSRIKSFNEKRTEKRYNMLARHIANYKYVRDTFFKMQDAKNVLGSYELDYIKSNRIKKDAKDYLKKIIQT